MYFDKSTCENPSPFAEATADTAKAKSLLREEKAGVGYRRDARTTTGEEGLLNMRFCETNRIGLGMKTGDKLLWWNWMRSAAVRIPIRFVWETNRISDMSRFGDGF
jgi:hypothetical protein